MHKQTTGVKSLLKDLEAGKRQLKAEYEKSVRAIDEAIKILSVVKLDISGSLGKASLHRGPGRPKRNAIDINAIVKKVKGKGKPGRPLGSKAKFNGNLTQMLHDIVVSKKRFTHSRNIVDSIIRKFPNEDRVDFSKKISVLLASLKKQKRLVTVKDGGYRKNMYWGSPDWILKGKIKKGFEFRKTQ